MCRSSPPERLCISSSNPTTTSPVFATQGMTRLLRNPEQMLVVTPTDSGHVKFGGKKMITQTKEKIRQFIFDGCQPLSGLPSN